MYDNFWSNILYHLGGSHASGTLVPSWLLFLYSFLRKDDTMARKKKGELPSGNIRRQVYNGMKQKTDKSGIPLFDENGKPIMIRDYISITADSVKEAERVKCEAVLNKKGKQKPSNLTLRQAIDEYIDSLRATKSPKTIAGYETIRDNAFPTIMDLSISKLDNTILQRAIDAETIRPVARYSKPQPISSKTLKNEWGLVATILKKYAPTLNVDVSIPEAVSAVHELSRPEDIFAIVKGTPIELPVLLAMWLSFTMSEIKGLTKSESIKGDYLYIAEVEINVNGKQIRKQIAKNNKRNRMHRIPPYIKELIDQVETDQLVTLSSHAVYSRFVRLLKKHNMPHMTFHDLRHVNASVMSFLSIPTQYAMDRGGWASDKVMKKTYMQIYAQERVAVDDTIDDYFSDALNLEPSIVGDKEKYNAWLLLFDKKDSIDSQNEYLEFVKVQHEMQHKKEKA